MSITKEQLNKDIKEIINLDALRQLYDNSLDNAFFDIQALKEIGSAVYFYIKINNLNSACIPELGQILGRLDDTEMGAITMAQYLYFCFFISQIDLTDKQPNNNLYL